MLTDTKPDPLRSGLLSRPGCRISHGFFTRAGGVSEGIYSGLNVGQGSSDNPEHIAENRRRVADVFGTGSGELATPHQIHSPDVISVSAPFSDERPRADGIVTATPNIAIGILTADCGPVLFADHDAGVIGAAHAGWKGALTGVLENTVLEMEKLGAKRDNTVAVLGPMISQQNYEVGPEFVARVVNIDADNGKWFKPSRRDDHTMFDLDGYIVDRLTRAGVTASSLNICTYADEERFYSYRRTTHRCEPDYGRQISTIILEKN